MNAERPSQDLPICPDPKTLALYAVGKLAPRQIQEIAEHVDHCDRCAESLESLGDNDTLISTLRRHAPAGVTPDTDAETSWVGRRVGPYEILEMIGAGSMGTVYKARQLDLNRVDAVKIARSSLGVQARARFRTEGQAIARLSHPNIVRVYACGEQNGCPYIAMELVEGRSLAQKIVAGSFTEREAAELVQTLADAVAFAHKQEVIHRDLKPANVLVAADGSVKLTDFGLAKLLDIEDGQTQRETVLGTASYMAPEQARGDIAEVGVPADVYGLGAILYEMLTGRAPFRAETRMETLLQVQSQEPVRPTLLRARLCRSLEAVSLKCLEKQPSRRYASAAELANDLQRWLTNRPTHARPIGPLGRCWKLVQRRPLLAAGLLCGMTAVAVAAVWWSLLEPSPERRYQQQVAPTLARLKQGEPIELIRPGEAAPASRVRCGENITKARATEEGFVVTTPVLGIVEFLPDVPWPSFRIHAEFRHDQSRFGPVGDGGVGIAFSYRDADSPAGKQHVFGAVALEDWDQRKRDGVLKSRAMLQLVWYLDTPTDGQSPFKHHHRYPPKREVWYPSPAGPDGVWHTLVIEVNSAGRTAVLSDCPGQVMGPLRPEHYRTFPAKLVDLHDEARGVQFAPLDQIVIGAIVSGGQMTLRRLRIEPQQKAEKLVTP
jgi:serine/threonine protein kinase